MHCNQLDQALDSKVGERHYAILTDPENPDHAVFDFHFAGDVEQLVFAFAEVLGDAPDCGETPMATKYTPQELQHHLGYEIDMMNRSYWLIYQIRSLLDKTDAPALQKDAASNAMKEDFCLHARALIEFFFKRKENSATGFAVPGYKEAVEPKDWVRALNNQIVHVMDGRTALNAEKLQDDDWADILRWLDQELRRWMKDRDGSYATITFPHVDLSSVPTAFAKVTTSTTAGPTSQFGSVGGTISP
jgi:hypothetical protein